MRFKFILTLSISLFITTYAQAQKHHRKNVFSTDTLKVTKKVNLLALPVIFYGPETSLAFGIGGQAFLLRKMGRMDSQMSSIFAAVVYTLNNQLIIDVKPKLYLQKGQYLLDTKFKYKIYPNNFWGIGNNTPESNLESYNMTSVELDVSYLKHLPPLLNFGVNYVFQRHDVTEVEAGGILDSESITGSEGTTVSGIGVVFNLDDRDSDIIPEKGFLTQFTARVFTLPLGSKTNFFKYMLDLRKYFQFGETKRNSLSIRAYSELSFGEVPFQMASWYGGGDRGRGYFRGRYIDNHLYIFQAEYRHKILKRWKVAGFVGLGGVSDVPEFLLERMKWNVGGGFRFQVTKNNPTVLRFDLGFGEDNNSGFYVGVNEAF